MAGTIKTSTLNCTENAVSTYSLAGVPLTTATLFTKTFTASTGHIFTKAPSINLNSVINKNSYSITINDTGSIAGGNLTVRSFVVKYKYPLKQVQNDTISFVARAELDIANSVGKIYNFILNKNWVPASGETRLLSVFGDESDANNAAATFTLDFKQGSTSVRVSPTGVSGSGTVTIPTGGRYDENLVFPQVTSNKTYTVILTQIANNSFLTLPTPKTITIPQYIDPVIEINATQSASKFITTDAAAIRHTDSPFSSRAKEIDIDWRVTSQSSSVPMKYVGAFNYNDFSADIVNSNGILGFTDGTKLIYNNLVVEIYPVQTAVTAGATTGTAITLTGINNSILKGMRVTGSGITHTGANSTLVTAVSGTSVTLSKSSTIASGTTLTFHPMAHITGSVTFKKLGFNNQTSGLVVDNIIDFNQPPVPTFTGIVSISAEEAGSFTGMTPTATDAESDTLTFKVTVMPQHGTFKYTDVQNNLQTITCTGQTLTSNNTLHATTRLLQYKPADGNSQNTSFQYTVADPHNAAVATTITLNIAAG